MYLHLAKPLLNNTHVHATVACVLTSCSFQCFDFQGFCNHKDAPLRWQGAGAAVMAKLHASTNCHAWRHNFFHTLKAHLGLSKQVWKLQNSTLQPKPTASIQRQHHKLAPRVQTGNLPSIHTTLQKDNQLPIAAGILALQSITQRQPAQTNSCR